MSIPVWGWLYIRWRTRWHDMKLYLKGTIPVVLMHFAASAVKFGAIGLFFWLYDLARRRERTPWEPGGAG